MDFLSSKYIDCIVFNLLTSFVSTIWPTIETIRTVGILPDLSGLEAGTRAGLPLYYRPAPSLGWQTKQAAAMLARVLDAYPVAADD